MYLEESLLDDVQRIFWVVKHPKRDGKEFLLVSRNEDAKSMLIPVTTTLNKILIVELIAHIFVVRWRSWILNFEYKHYVIQHWGKGTNMNHHNTENKQFQPQARHKRFQR